MIFIAHRGNLNGPNKTKENHPEYIEAAIREGFDVEIDLWYFDNSFWLGHDIMEYQINDGFLLKHQQKLWCHAKSVVALKELLDLNMHCFYHERDKATLTSKNFIWTHPDCNIITSQSIYVLPGKRGGDFSKAAGVCSDYIDDIRSKYES